MWLPQVFTCVITFTERVEGKKSGGATDVCSFQFAGKDLQLVI